MSASISSLIPSAAGRGPGFWTTSALMAGGGAENPRARWPTLFADDLDDQAAGQMLDRSCANPSCGRVARCGAARQGRQDHREVTRVGILVSELGVG